MVSRHPAPTHVASPREAILDAASALFGEVGYHRMTIDEVAKRANLGKGTIYLYFDSKQELAISILSRMNGRVREQHRATLRSHGTPEERLRTMLIERVMMRFDLVRDYREGLDQMYACMRPLLLEKRRTCSEEEALDFMEILVEGRTVGAFECDDPAGTARALLAATASLLPYSLSATELGSRKDLEERALFMSDMLIRALRPCDPNGMIGQRIYGGDR